MQDSVWARLSEPMPEMQQTLEAQRRTLGIFLGAMLGASYGIVAQLINRIALPGVPLYQPPLGPAGNIVLLGLVGAGLGFLTAWPPGAALGIFFGGLAAALAVFVSTLLRVGTLAGLAGAMLTSVIFTVPIAWVIVPLVALLRWAADKLAESGRQPTPLMVRWRTPLLFILLMAALAAFELLPGATRSQLNRAHAMIQAGLHASSAAEAPAPLRGPRVEGFAPAAGGRYTLEWTDFDLDRFIELRPAANYDQHTAVIARFTGGYTLVCLYPTPKSEPTCGTY